MDEISYTQKFYSDSLTLDEDIFRNYVMSIKGYIKLFRSGPDSQKRKFTFIYILNIYNNNFNEGKNMIEFTYPPNSKPQINNLIEQGEYLQSILKYIEEVYQKEKVEEIKILIEKINDILEI